MTTLDNLQALMDELGPETPEITAIAQQGDSMWGVTFEDEQTFLIELDSAGETLMLSTDVGRPAEGAKLDVFQAALTYTFVWKDTGGVRVAMGGSDEDLTLMLGLNVADLNLMTLQATMADLRIKAQIWAEYLAGASEAPTFPFGEPGIRI